MGVFLVNCIVRSEPIHVQDRLAELGLDEETLREAVRRGHLAFVSCTPNHPPAMPGFVAWGETVSGLRDLLAPKGWRRSDRNNYSVTLSPDLTIAIAVATGDEATGRHAESPTTKAWKGPSTRDAVSSNQLRLALVFHDGHEPPIHSREDAWSTWILLSHRDRDEVRCELSLPSSFDDGYIQNWHERIVLTPVAIDRGTLNVPVPDLPDIAIDIKRKA